MDQIVQIAGAVLILVAFVAAQRGVMSPQSPVYLVLNFVGSLALGIVAALGPEWGFLLLEGVWALVSLYGLVALVRDRRAGTAAT